ncbi:MAG: bifunctional adenosylcobinamide kinase/adenosylcobinamide-phosphate guanylyltransferase, partial [Firmicutes bacterium]|nr:bifunctional adenosylcobinamide kinase/adenosylcobinamide-phosphate guanylyltransferase [Bacillota bacterium]
IDQLIRRFSDKEDLDDLITDNENASIIVANEIEDGIAPADEKEERGRKLLRTTYDKLEEKADTVIYMMAGVPKYLKGEKI